MKITNDQGQTFGTFCGNKTGEVVYATADKYAFATFHSDGIVNGPGYKLVFSVVPQGKINASYVLFNKWKIREWSLTIGGEDRYYFKG